MGLLMAYIKSLNAQANLPGLGHETRVKSRRRVIPDRSPEDDVRLSVETDMEGIAAFILKSLPPRLGRPTMNSQGQNDG